MRTVFCLMFAVILAGCAHVVSQDLRADAEKNIDMVDLFARPELYEGKTVIVGGIIIETTSLEDTTMLEVLEKPLDFRGRPRDTDVSRGRFIVRHPGRLDPAIFRPGREITTVAEVMGSERRPLGEIDYPYLSLASKAIYIHKGTARGRKMPIHFGIGIYHSF